MQILWEDLTYGLRMLLKNPGFTAVAVCALALGIGANSAIFSVVNAVLLRPLPYEGADRLVMVWTKFENLGLPQGGISEPELLELTSPSHVFEHVAAYASLSFNLTGRAEPERIVGARVSSSMFATLGV